jgi:hypothetical protein
MRRRVLTAAFVSLFFGLYGVTGAGWFLSAAILACVVLVENSRATKEGRP